MSWPRGLVATTMIIVDDSDKTVVLVLVLLSSGIEHRCKSRSIDDCCSVVSIVAVCCDDDDSVSSCLILFPFFSPCFVVVLAAPCSRIETTTTIRLSWCLFFPLICFSLPSLPSLLCCSSRVQLVHFVSLCCSCALVDSRRRRRQRRGRVLCVCFSNV